MRRDRSLVYLRAALGGLTGPIRIVMVLHGLIVIGRVLLFTLIPPATALLARLLLHGFQPSCGGAWQHAFLAARQMTSSGPATILNS